jgi:hypothetical protein
MPADVIDLEQERTRRRARAALPWLLVMAAGLVAFVIWKAARAPATAPAP